jgi:hypothetical protein
MAIILSLEENRWLAGCGAYIGAFAIRQATAGMTPQALRRRTVTDRDYDNFTQMNPI